MAQQPARRHRSEDVRSARRGTTRAALGGALIGALTGLTGSVLVFIQAGWTQDAAEKARQADIRREAYAGVGTSFLTFKTEIVGVRNFITDPDIGLARREEQYNTRYIPAYAKLQQADLAARLVATNAAKKSLARARPSCLKLRDIIHVAYSSDQLDGPKFTKEFDFALQRCDQLIHTFIDEVDEEVL